MSSKGRPTDYDPLVQRMFSLGAIDKEVIESLAVARSTFYLWKMGHKEFAETINEGKAFFDNGRVESALLNRALGGIAEEVTVEEDDSGKVVKRVTKTRAIPGETGALKFWLTHRNAHRWSIKEREEEGESRAADLIHDLQVHDPEAEEVDIPATVEALESIDKADKDG